MVAFLLLGVEHFARQLLGGDVHLFGGAVVDAHVAIFGEGKWDGALAAVLQLTRGEAEPAIVDAEGDFLGRDFDDGVVCAVETVSGCVAAQKRGPGGPEFGVETVVQI